MTQMNGKKPKPEPSQRITEDQLCQREARRLVSLLSVK
jgi:hypothetical protein